MGFNTTVVVMNDALGMIANDPTFGENLARAIMKVQRGECVDVPAFSTNGLGVHCNAATVIESHHADRTVYVAVGGNCGEVIGYEDAEAVRKLLRKRAKAAAVV